MQNLILIKEKLIWRKYKYIRSNISLILEKELYKIAEEEMKKFTENSEYNKYQVGEEINLNQDFTKNDVS